MGLRAYAQVRGLYAWGDIRTVGETVLCLSYRTAHAGHRRKAYVMRLFALNSYVFRVAEHDGDLYLSAYGTDGEWHGLVFLSDPEDRLSTFAWTNEYGVEVVAMDGETLWAAWDKAADITDSRIR